MRIYFSAIVGLIACTVVAAQTPPQMANPLARHYRDGETLRYHMTGGNDEWHYTADAAGIVKKDAGGRYIEEFRWISMSSNGHVIAADPAMANFREVLSLDTALPPSPPDLSKVDGRFVGPITDLMTFYVDLWLANKVGVLQQPGDHFYMPNPQAGSWADGTHILTGESLIDFDLTLRAIDSAKKTAALVVRHVPPPHPNLQLPAAWMQAPVADTPNNWAQVSRTKEGNFEAGVGKETFNDSITVSTIDGRILSAAMDNVVLISERVCDDAALTHCGDAHPRTIHRHIQIALER